MHYKLLLRTLYVYRVYRNMWDPLQGWIGGTPTMKKIHINMCPI